MKKSGTPMVTGHLWRRIGPSTQEVQVQELTLQTFQGGRDNPYPSNQTTPQRLHPQAG